MSSQAAGRRRSNNRQYSAEDQALNMISKEAEARLAAKRAARAEAREIRMKEMEKQQKDTEEKQDRIYELTNEHAAAKIRQQISGSRRGSTESNDSVDGKDVDYKAEIRELEEKYKAAMMTSAQLDNEKQSLVYQVELLKDQLEEQDEGYTELQREYKDKCREFELQKRDVKSMEHELSILKQQLELKDRLIQESGFVIMANDRGEPVLEKQSSSPSASSSNGPLPSGAFLVSPETKDFLERAGDGTLGTRVVSNLTDKHLVSPGSSSSSSDQVDKGHGNIESSKSLVATSSEADGHKSLSNSSLKENVGLITDVRHKGEEEEAGEGLIGSSDKAMEELHAGTADVVGVKSEHDLKVKGDSLQSERYVEEEKQKREGENVHESKSSDCASPSPHPLSLQIEGSKVNENESDENDEFFDSVTSPTSDNSSTILNSDKLKGVDSEASTNIISPSDIAGHAISSGFQCNIENVTLTETSTDDYDRRKLDSLSQVNDSDKGDSIRSKNMQEPKILNSQTEALKSQEAVTGQGIDAEGGDGENEGALATNREVMSMVRQDAFAEDGVTGSVAVEIMVEENVPELVITELEDTKGDQIVKVDMTNSRSDEASIAMSMAEQKETVENVVGEADTSKEDKEIDSCFSQEILENPADEQLVPKEEKEMTIRDENGIVVEKLHEEEKSSKEDTVDGLETKIAEGEEMEVSKIVQQGNAEEDDGNEASANCEVQEVSKVEKAEESTMVKQISLRKDSGLEDPQRPPNFMDRATSIGGESQCSEGALMNNYDLDDISEILNPQEDNTLDATHFEAVTEDGKTSEAPGEGDDTSEQTGAVGGGEEEKVDGADASWPQDQAVMGVEEDTKSESQQSAEPEDLEEALDMKVKEKSKKKSMRFKLFKKVFK